MSVLAFEFSRAPLTLTVALAGLLLSALRCAFDGSDEVHRFDSSICGKARAQAAERPRREDGASTRREFGRGRR